MGDEEEKVTLDEQYIEFAKFMENERNETTITLYESDYWLRQSKVLDDRKLTMTDTGLMWNQFNKRELNYEEWYEYLTELCYMKDMNLQEVKNCMTSCGLPGEVPIVVPQYRDFFDTYVPANKLVGIN